jgi:hypothetical protein
VSHPYIVLWEERHIAQTLGLVAAERHKRLNSRT